MFRAASGASAIVRTMFGDDERPRLGQIEHLPDAVADARVRIEARAAPKAGRRVMIDDLIGISDLPQRLAFVTLLPARFLAGTFPQARHPCRLLQPIARRRLAAVRTVQPEPALEFGHPRSQRRILRLQRRYQRDQVFRGRHARRFANHPILESEPAVAVEEILFRLSLSPYLGCYIFMQKHSSLQAVAARELFTNGDHYGRVSDHTGYCVEFEPNW